MPDLPRYVNQLGDALLALGEGSMLLEVLDGFIAGLLICPELIPVPEWLGWVWDMEGGGEPIFDSDFDKIAGLVMQHYNATAKILFERPHRYGPLFAVDERNDDILWELWIEGFDLAYKLRPSAWQKCLDAEGEVARAISGLLRLVGAVQRDPAIPKEEYAVLSEAAPDNIARWVIAINEWRFATEDPRNISAFFPPPKSRIGRNEPCPCGSGKKYKKCCAMN